MRDLVLSGIPGRTFSFESHAMTNRIAIILGLIIVAGLGFDMIRNDSAGLVFLGRKFIEFVEYLAFWR
ncbi:hypothetical protein RA2_00606 [Roseovarius sp. A-2]|nr:hypothetical protein RA2_00606 [Roseovarius sp. A-2]